MVVGLHWQLKDKHYRNSSISKPVLKFKKFRVCCSCRHSQDTWATFTVASKNSARAVPCRNGGRDGQKAC